MSLKNQWNRRRFLQAAALTLGGSVLSAGCSQPTGGTESSAEQPGSKRDGGLSEEASSPDRFVKEDTQPETSTERKPAEGSLKHVLVVGAGMAGLTAAQELSKAGFPVLVIEGRDRTGGRIYTDNRFGFPAEQGAQWIEGVQGNPLTQLAQQLQFQTQPTDFEDIAFFGMTGKPSDATELQAIERGFGLLERQVASYSGTTDVSVGSLLQSVTGIPEEVRRCVALVTEDGSGADLEEMSVKAALRAKGFPGGDAILVKGYSQFIEHQAKGLDIRLNQTVKMVDTSETFVKLTTQDGTEYLGAAVILTVPLGVLKASTTTQAGIRFVPELPAAKKKAIADSGYGLLNKIYIQFKQTFWSNQQAFLTVLPPKDDDFVVFVNHAHSHQKPVLAAFVAASFARQLETMTDSQLTQAVVAKLRVVYGAKVKDDDVEKVLVTRWGQDPFALGSYSFSPVNRFQWREALAAPVGKTLHFAGEACSEYNATAHGAYSSGLVVGKAVTAALKS
ncbi:MAG: FAD-binding protein [Deltaproteobacteria bacterium]|nr:MAG: FAD-binding protein [Deltaproteobacteria bacterium]